MFLFNKSVTSLAQSRFECYPAHGIFYQYLIDNGFFDATEFFRGPYSLVSSLGNLDRLNILTSYLASNSPPGGDGMTVTDVIFSLRNRGMGFSCLTYQYNGILTCNFSAALEKSSQEMFDATTDAFKDWIKVLF